MFYQIFIQSLAIIALIIWGSSYHFKKRKSILIIQLISFIFWVSHFILLGAYTGAALSAIAALRLGFFSFKKKGNWTSSPFVLFGFIGLVTVFTIFTFSAYWVIFALIGSIFAIIASWQYSQNKIRILFLPSHASWIIYDLFAGSYGGAISEAVLGVSALVSFLRNRKK